MSRLLAPEQPPCGFPDGRRLHEPKSTLMVKHPGTGTAKQLTPCLRAQMVVPTRAAMVRRKLPTEVRALPPTAGSGFSA